MTQFDLLQQLQSKNPKDRAESARKLGELKDREAVPALVEALADAGEARQDIIWALGEIRDPSASRDLIPFLQHENWHLRAASAEALGKIQGGDGVVDALIKSLDDQQDAVFWKAAWALGEIGDPGAFDPLRKWISGENTQRRWQSAWALARLGDPRAAAPILPLLEDNDTVVRRHALMALQILKDPASIKAIISRLDDSDWQNRNFAAGALLALGRAAVPHLEKHSESAPREIREKIRWILDSIREED